MEKMKPTIPEILPLLREYHAGTHPNGGWNGGSLHIVLIDGNVKDEDVRFSLEWAKEHGDTLGQNLAELLLAMSKTQRLKAGVLFTNSMAML
jgi:hypothetical protein